VSKSNQSKESGKPQHFVKIVYLDSTDNLKDTSICIDDIYDDKDSLQENMEDIMSDINADGGFWINDTTIVPFHRVRTISYLNKTTEQKDSGSEADRRQKDCSDRQPPNKQYNKRVRPRRVRQRRISNINNGDNTSRNEDSVLSN
jgi:hypothetical protein